MPEELKVIGSDLVAKKVKLDEDGVVSSWSTGIAEVQLPMSYKLKNIEATEKAANNALKYSLNLHGKSATYQRFQISDSSQITLPMDAAEYSHSGSQNHDINLNKRQMKSTDDLALQRYKVRFNFHMFIS